MNGPHARPRALLLDVMGTLVHDPFYVEVPAFFGMTLAQLVEAKHPKTWVRFEEGAVGEAWALANFFADARPFDHAGLERSMRAAYRWLEGMEELLADLVARGVALHALSNYSPWYRWIEEELGLSRYIAWSFVSCDTGLRKPAREAFLGATRALGIAPGACLLVDDRAENCRAAREVGMAAVEFAGAAALRAELARRGLVGCG